MQPLAPTFLAALDEPLRTGAAGFGELEPTLVRIVAAATSEWPTLTASAEGFVAHLARVLPGDRDLAESLAAVRAGDLFLAFACAVGDAVAVEAFEERHRDEVDAALVRLRVAPDIADEIRARLRHKLLLPDGDRPPRIAEYRGRGALAGWVRASAFREAVDLLRRQQRERPIEEVGPLADGMGADPEMERIKERYRVDFQEAFKESLAALSPRERTVLRYQLIDGLGIDAIGALHDVHRATAARWLEKAREKILSGTKRRLLRRLGIAGPELESLLRLVQSRIDVTLSALLRSGPDHEER